MGPARANSMIASTRWASGTKPSSGPMMTEVSAEPATTSSMAAAASSTVSESRISVSIRNSSAALTIGEPVRKWLT